MRGMDKGGTLKGERTKSKNTSKYIFPSVKNIYILPASLI